MYGLNTDITPETETAPFITVSLMVMKIRYFSLIVDLYNDFKIYLTFVFILSHNILKTKIKL